MTLLVLTKSHELAYLIKFNLSFYFRENFLFWLRDYSETLNEETYFVINTITDFAMSHLINTCNEDVELMPHAHVNTLK